MAQDLVVGGDTYTGVERVAATNTDGEVIVYPEGGDTASNAVQYVPQKLNEAKQTQARRNINAMGCDDIYFRHNAYTYNGDTEHITTVTINVKKIVDGKEVVESVEINNTTLYEHAKLHGYEGEIAEFYDTLAQNMQTLKGDGLELDPNENILYITSGGKRIGIGVGLPQGGITDVDLSVNDPDAAGYVKGRTHWKEVERAVSFFARTDLTDTVYHHPEPIGLEKGETYEAVCNGNFYNVTPVEFDSAGNTGLILVKDDGANRNQSITGLPFTFVEFDKATAASAGYYALVRSDLLDSNGKYYLSITGNRNTWHKLDKRYLPDELGEVKRVNGKLPDEYGNVNIPTGVLTVNWQTPDEYGNAQVDVGVKTVNGQTPDASGNVNVSGGSGGGAQADLAENDPNAAGYVKNRTHWRELELGDIIFDKPSLSNLVFSDRVNVTGEIADALVEGSTYLVTWNGAEYKCVCGMTADGQPYIGNPALNDSAVETADYPFCIVGLGGKSYKVIRGKISNKFAVKVQALIKEEWHKLDKAYLPEPISLALGDYGVDLEAIVNAGGSAVVENTSLLWSKVADAWQAGNRLRVSIPAGDTELCVSDPMIWKVDDAGLCLSMNTALVMDTSLVALYIMFSPEVNDGEVNTVKTTVYAKSVLLG